MNQKFAMPQIDVGSNATKADTSLEAIISRSTLTLALAHHAFVDELQVCRSYLACCPLFSPALPAGSVSTSLFALTLAYGSLQQISALPQPMVLATVVPPTTKSYSLVADRARLIYVDTVRRARAQAMPEAHYVIAVTCIQAVMTARSPIKLSDLVHALADEKEVGLSLHSACPLQLFFTCAAG